MSTYHALSIRSIAALIAALALSSPAFASNNENHPANHAEGSNDHSQNSHPENHGGNSDSGANSQDRGISAALTGDIQAGARGEAKLKTKTRGNRFEAEVKIPVPGTALDIPDKTAAQNTTPILHLSRSGIPYAECDLDLKSFKSGKNGGVAAKYKIEIIDRGGNLQERYGICDIDLSTPGIQSGLPMVQSGDTATVTADTNGMVFLNGVFVRGNLP